MFESASMRATIFIFVASQITKSPSLLGAGGFLFSNCFRILRSVSNMEETDDGKTCAFRHFNGRKLVKRV